MERKLLSQLKAQVRAGAVNLTAYKSTPVFQNRTAAVDPFRALRVYRSEETNFTFGEGSAEYFTGLAWQDATLVFEGPLRASNDRKFAFTDTSVEKGSRPTHTGWEPSTVPLIGVIHGGESGAELMLPAIEGVLKQHDDLLDEVSIAAIPVVNVDER